MLLPRLFVVSITWLCFVDRQEAGSIRNQLNGWKDDAAERLSLGNAASWDGPLSRRPRSRKVLILQPPSKDPTQIEEDALNSIEQLEGMMAAMDEASKTGAGTEQITNILGQYSDGRKRGRWETKDHEIERIVTKVIEPPDRLSKRDASARSLARGVGDSETEGRGNRRIPRKARRKDKVMTVITYPKGKGDDDDFFDDDDDDNDDDDDDYADADEDDEVEEIIEYVDTPKKRPPKIKMIKPRKRVQYMPFGRSARPTVLELPSDLLYAMYKAKKAKEKPMQTIQIIEVKKKGNEPTPPAPAASAPAAPAGPAPPAAGPPPPPGGGPPPPGGGPPPPGGAPQPPGGAPPPPGGGLPPPGGPPRPVR